ncbi:uncharacterized protein LOC123874050 [Maniola jurtina]|uniref:uncharacterized protein LOC123874050 n=1 Tax=Maniola jurtina TaxID=191418 RepID=UPI001E68AE3C|nr:uncharacterized protein LOC123874050 [Maniola jurtina]
MCSRGEIVDLVDLSDNDDDCVMESVVYKPKKKNDHIIYDNIYNENPLLAEIIEKCLNLESSEGMLRVVNKTLLEIYKEADPKFKSSSEFETVLKKTLIRLDKDPYHKFSHIKDLCETLRSSKFKKRVQLITLDKKVRKKSFAKLALKRKSYLERKSKKQKTDVIDLDKYEETPYIDLDQNDSIQDGPIVIDDEKENNSSQENSDCSMEIDSDPPTVHDDGKMHNHTGNKNSKVLNSQKVNEGTILNIDDEKENQSSQENYDCFIEINANDLRIHDNRQSDNNIGTTSSENANNNSESSKNANCHKSHADNTEDVSMNIDDEKQSHTAEESGYCFAKNNENNLLIQSKGHFSHRSPEKLLVPQKVFDFSVEDKPLQFTESIKLKYNIELLESEIARYKELIVKLEEQEVTDDNFSSPYIRSNKYKEKIVKLYKELCTLTGAEATKRREVRLTAIEGHPPGPVKSLESFLNRNIGEDGNPPFPDFNDVVKCVETANVNDNLGWNKLQVMREASALFTHCGRALQKRRQKREWSDLLSRVKSEQCDDDPADNDPELLARLEANRRVAIKKEKDILESDLLSRVKSEQCDDDPADNDPELLARLEANRRVAIKKEADILERYSMMQNLPPESKRKTGTNAVTQPQDAVQIASVKFGSDDASDETDSPQVNTNENNIITHAKENKTNHLNNIKIVSINCNSQLTAGLHCCISAACVAHSAIETNKINLVQNSNLIMPQIIADSITNKSYTDEFGLKINDSKQISNVEVNNCSASNITIKTEPNFPDVDFETNVALNETNVSSVAFESNVEANCESNLKSDVGDVNFESNVATNKTHVSRMTFESNVEANCESNIKSDVGDVNFESNAAINKTPVAKLPFESNVEANCESNTKSNVEEINFEINVVTNESHISRLTESNVEDDNLKANILEVKIEPNIEQLNTQSNAEEHFESNSEEVNSIEASVKTEFNEGNIKTEPTENVARILQDFGDNYTVSIFDIADPFLIVEISDSSDDED